MLIRLSRENRKDGKLIEQLDSKTKEERFPIIVSSIFGTKVFGVLSIGHNLWGRYRDTAAKAVIDHLEKWNCKSAVFSRWFDTPNTNIGQIKGFCITIEKMLGKSLLCLACRHHIGETIILHVWVLCEIEKSNAPTRTLFTNLVKKLDEIDFTGPIYLPGTDKAANCIPILKSAELFWQRFSYRVFPGIVFSTVLFFGLIFSNRFFFSFFFPTVFFPTVFFSDLVFCDTSFSGPNPANFKIFNFP